MERVWAARNLTRTERIQFCSILVYKFGKFTRLIPFDYKIRKSRPDEIIYIPQSAVIKSISFFLATVVTAFILYWYFAVFLGKMTQVESSMAIAGTAVLCIMNSAQWAHILKYYRTGGLIVANFILDAQFRDPQNPMLVSELLHEVSVIAAINCQVLTYPFLVYTSRHFPALLSMLNSGVDFIAGLIFGNSLVGSVVLRHGTYAVLSLAVGDALIHQSILAMWLFPFQCTMNQYLQRLLESLKNFAGRPGTETNGKLWGRKDLDPPSFLKTEVLFVTIDHIFGRIFASYALNYIIAIIYTMFLLVSSAADLPSWITCTVGVTSLTFLVCALIMFKQATDAHIFMQELILANTEECRGKRVKAFAYKFWRSMRPRTTTILGLCSFETKEFLLVIWADVIVMSIINLLLAF